MPLDSQPPATSLALESFVPRELCDALHRGERLPERTTGAALFADICGFTPLTEAFIEVYGASRGAELLVHHLEGVFSHVARAVHAHGGSIMGFAGDAVTCWFDASAGTAGEPRAAAAALRMRDAINGTKITLEDGSEFDVSVRVAVSAGPVRRFAVGAPRHQQSLLLAGDTIRRLAIVDAHGQPGEVLVSEEVLAAELAGMRVESWRDLDDGHRAAVIGGEPAERLADDAPIGRLPREALLPWLLKPVAARIASGRGGFLGGFHPVAALFITFDGYDYDGDEDAGAHLDAFVCEVQDAVDEFDGHIEHITIGDKGSYLLAGFGALRADEHDARRAIGAAHKILALAGRERMPKRIAAGIANARVYAGLYGCPERRTFGMVGREVVLAVRLMSLAAPGEILVSPRIAAAAAGSYDFEAGEPRALKGFATPMAPHRVLARRQLDTRPQAAVRMFGRQHELQQLVRLIEGVAAGTDQAGRLCIEGDAGIGKSTLLANARAAAEHAGVRVLKGGADAVTRAAAFHVWRPVFENLIGLSGLDSQARAARCRDWLRHPSVQAEPLLPLLNPVLGLDVEETPQTRAMEGLVRADNTSDLLLRILRGVDEPVLLILEDLHWFDSASRSLLQVASVDLREALIMVTRRPPLDDEAAALLPRGFETMRLGPLGADAAADLICETLGVEEVPADVSRWIVGKADGSPFFCRELAIALHQAGALVPGDGRCELAGGIAQLDALDFPDTIQGVIASRLDQLADKLQLTVKIASVIGRQFAVRVLRAVHPVAADRADLEHSLDAIERAEIAHPEPALEDPAYLFNHALTQEVAYSRLLHEQRAQLHRAVGEWLEAHVGRDASSLLPLLAHHYANAVVNDRSCEDPVREKALDYLTRAGLQALRAYMNREAHSLFTQAIELATDAVPGSPRVWHAGLAHAHMASGEFSQAQVHARAAFALMGEPLPMGVPARALASLGLVARIGMRMIRRRSWLPEWSGEVPAAGADFRPDEPMLLLRVYSKSLWHCNDILGMLCANLRSLELSEDAGPGAETALAYGHIMLTLDVFRMAGRARQFGDRALALARASNSPATEVAVHIAHGLVHLGHARWQAADDAFDLARERAVELGDDWQWGEAQAIAADMALFRGETEIARRRYQELEIQAERRDMPIQKAWCLRPHVLQALADNDAERALGLLGEWRDILERSADPLMQIDSLGFAAAAHWARGEREAALDAVAQALARIPALSPPVAYPRYLGYCSLAQVCLEDCALDPADETRRERARVIIRSLAEYAKAYAHAAPRAALLSAWLRGIDGRPAAAVRQIRRAIEDARALRMAPEVELGEELLKRFG